MNEPDPAAVLRAYGYSDEQILAMAPEQLKAEYDDAIAAGVDARSAEENALNAPADATNPP